MGPLVLDSLTVMPAGHKTDPFSSEGTQSSTALLFVRACEQLCLLLEGLREHQTIWAAV